MVNLNITISLDSIIAFLENNTIITFIGLGGVLIGIAKLIFIYFKYKYKKDKLYKDKREKEYKKIDEIISNLYNKDTANLQQKLSKENLSIDELFSISEQIHNLYTKANKIFLSVESIIDKKIFNKIKEKNLAYRYYIIPNNVPGNNIDLENDDLLLNIQKLSKEIKKLPSYITKQFELYLEFDMILYQVLNDKKEKLAKQIELK